jgi:kumamolisin
MLADSHSARWVRPVDPSEVLEVLLLLRTPGTSMVRDVFALGSLAVRDRTHLTARELSRQLTPGGDEIHAIRRFAAGHRLQVRGVNVGRRFVVLRGRAGDMTRAFSVEVSHYETADHVFRSYEGALSIPAYLERVVSGVFGLDNRPVSRRPRFAAGAALVPPPPNPGTKHPSAFRRLYAFPTRAIGRDQCIGVLEFGGGFERRKLRAYLSRLGSSAPTIVVREVGSGRNRPVNQPGTLSPDVEVYMDLEILAGVAPGATLVVYFAENSNRGWVEALHAAIFDERHRLSVLSISWGQAEQYWDGQTIAAIDEALRMAALRGITVCCSSGDRGVFEAGRHPYTVPFPASSPHVLACGGTKLEMRASGGTRETVWNESGTVGLTSGGGISRAFDLPPFQEGCDVPARFGTTRSGRGTPDVAANASSLTGYLILADDTSMSMGGTSAAAPLWAGLIACLNEALGRRIGYLTPLLYRHGAQRRGALRDVRVGNNQMSGRRGYKARPGWDPCTGLGSPHGVTLLQWLKTAGAAKKG